MHDSWRERFDVHVGRGVVVGVCGGDAGAEGGEVFGPGEGALAAGAFLPEFGHSDFSLGGIVCRRGR